MVIDRFVGPYHFLSNFHTSPVVFEGAVYRTVEHAYVAAKTTDNGLRCRVIELATPGDAKRFGRQIELRPLWDTIKRGVMIDLVRDKFRHIGLRGQLIATGDSELIEGNYWNDTYWGVCRGKGHNHLGKILMAVRQEILGENSVA